MTIDLDAIRERANAAHTEIANICAGKRRWTMSIPAKEATDSDLVLSKALNDVDVLLAELDQARAELADLKAAVVELAPAPSTELHKKYMALLETWERQQPVLEAAKVLRAWAGNPVEAPERGTYWDSWNTLCRTVDSLAALESTPDAVANSAAASSKLGDGLFRVGRHQPRNVYRADEYIGVMFTASAAAMVVAAMNRAGDSFLPSFPHGQTEDCADHIHLPSTANGPHPCETCPPDCRCTPDGPGQTETGALESTPDGGACICDTEHHHDTPFGPATQLIPDATCPVHGEQAQVRPSPEAFAALHPDEQDAWNDMADSVRSAGLELTETDEEAELPPNVEYDWPLNVSCPACGAPERVWCFKAGEGHTIGHVHDERREAAAVAVTEPWEATCD